MDLLCAAHLGGFSSVQSWLLPTEGGSSHSRRLPGLRGLGTGEAAFQRCDTHRWQVQPQSPKSRRNKRILTGCFLGSIPSSLSRILEMEQKAVPLVEQETTTLLSVGCSYHWCWLRTK